MTTLPRADWTQREDLAALVAALGPDQMRWVGGAVRDTLLGNPVKDIDAATVHEPGDARALAYRLGREQALDRLLLAGADVSPLDNWEIPELPLKGGEIVARGVSAGPEVARILREVEDRWVAEGFPGRERVEALLAERLAIRS